MQAIFEQKAREGNYKFLKTNTKNNKIDFSFNEFEIFDIALNNNFHLNFFKVLYKRKDCEIFFDSRKFFIKCAKYGRLDIIEYFSKKENDFVLYFHDVFITYYQNNDPRDKKQNKLVRKVLSHLDYKFSIENLRAGSFNFFDFLFSEYKYLYIFLSITEGFFNYKLKHEYLNRHINYCFDQLYSFALTEDDKGRINNAFKDSLCISFINQYLIDKYKDDKFLYSFLQEKYNSLINQKLFGFKESKDFEEHYLYFMDKTRQYDKIYDLEFSSVVSKAVRLESKKSVEGLIKFKQFKCISSKEFSHILFNQYISNSFTLFLLNLNLFSLEDIKENFIEGIQQDHTGTLKHSNPILIYNYLNDKNKFSKYDNLLIIDYLLNRHDNKEHPLFEAVFGNLVNFLEDYEIVNIINTTHSKKSEDYYGKTKYIELYSNYLLYNGKVLDKIKLCYKDIIFNSKEKQDKFFSVMNINSF